MYLFDDNNYVLNNQYDLTVPILMIIFYFLFIFL